MAHIVYSENALANLQRAFVWLVENSPSAAMDAAAAITQAIDILEQHPLIGRRVEGEIRELIISYGKQGYVALYRFIPGQDIVRILVIRHQLELDYPI